MRRPTHTTRYVYFAHDGRPRERIKVGMSVNPYWRLKELHCSLLFAVPCEYRFAHILERTIHQQFAHLRLPERGTSGGSEWFRVDDQVATLIRTVRTTRRWPFDGTKVVTE